MTKFIPSPQQAQAITHRGGHLRIVACAGSGKTESLARRIASLVQEGIEPSEIVAFTFTEKAAAELKERVSLRIEESMGEEFLGKLGAMFVGTRGTMMWIVQSSLVDDVGNKFKKVLHTVNVHRRGMKEAGFL